MDGQHNVPATFSIVKTQYPLHSGLGRPWGLCGQHRKSHSQWNSITRPSSLYRITIPTELSQLPVSLKGVSICCMHALVCMGRGNRGTSASKGIHTCPKNSFSRQKKQLAYTTKYNMRTAMLWKYTRLQVKHSNRRQGMMCVSSQSLQWYSLLSVYNISSISFEDTSSTVHPSYTHPQTLL